MSLIKEFVFESTYQLVTWVWIALSVGGLFYFASKENWRLAFYSLIGLVVGAIIMVVMLAIRFSRSEAARSAPGLKAAEFAKMPLSYDLSAADPEREFCDVFKFLRTNRPQMSKVAMEYYKSRVDGFEEAIPGVNLLSRETWIARNNPIDLSPGKSERLRLEMKPNPSISNAWTYGPKYLPWGRRYVENVQRYNQIFEKEESGRLRPRLFQAPLYQLTEFRATEDKIEISCCNSDYFSYINSCELLHYEFVRAVWLQFIDQCRKPDGAELSDEHLPLRKALDIFAFDNRCVGIGISTIFIMNFPGKPKFFIHKRDESKTSEAMGTDHVVPAGTFQPRREMPPAEDPDFSIYLNILRELGEELLGRKEMEGVNEEFSDITQEPRIELYHELVSERKAKVCFLGWGLDPLTTKAEFLTAMVVDMRKVGDPHFKSNFEGKPFETDFDAKNVQKFVSGNSTQPAGAGCAQLAWENREQLLSSVA